MKYFKLDEFACPCGCGRHSNKMNKEFLSMLDYARHEAGIPFKITSGYRCPTYNTTIGGKPNSAHLRGRAADIYVENGQRRWHMLSGISLARFPRLGIGADFIHVDIDESLPTPWAWTYYTKRGN